MFTRATVATGALLLLACLSSSKASAGSFEVLACDDAPRGVNHSWELETNISASLDVASVCPTTKHGAGLFAQLRPLSPPFHNPGSYAHWVFRAPPGLSVSRLLLRRMLVVGGETGWRPYGRQADKTILPGETCIVSSGFDDCTVGGRDGANYTTDVNTTELAYGFDCVATDLCTSGGIPDAAVAIYGARVTLTDSTMPRVGEVTGDLWDESRRHQGVSTATFTAQDLTGIREVRSYVDGVNLRTKTFPCDYTRTIPCANPVDPITVAYDFAGLPSGELKFQLGIVDAAGNETLTPMRTLKVGPEPPPRAPGGPFAPHGAAGESPLQPPAGDSRSDPGQRLGQARRKLAILRAIVRARSRTLFVTGTAPDGWRHRLHIRYSVAVGRRHQRLERTVFVKRGRWQTIIRLRSVTTRRRGRVTVTSGTKRTCVRVNRSG